MDVEDREIAVVLHDIRSAHNVGSIFRTADAAGVAKIYLCGITPAPQDKFGRWHPEIAKVALGAERLMPWRKISSALRLVNRLKSEGFKIFAVEQDLRSVPYHKMELPETGRNKIALVVGNEVKGLSKAVLASADKVLEIPMFGRKESLNAAVAFGIVAFHLRLLVEKRSKNNV